VPIRRILLWTALALGGLLVAVAVTTAATSLTSQRVGLQAEPLDAGDELVPRSVRTATPQPTATTNPSPAATATATETASDDGDDHGDGRGRGRGRGGDDHDDD
jgi:hypothetical protein